MAISSFNKSTIEETQCFYSLCIDTTTTPKRAALTIHWVLNDHDHKIMQEVVKSKKEVTDLTIANVVNAIEGAPFSVSPTTLSELRVMAGMQDRNFKVQTADKVASTASKISKVSPKKIEVVQALSGRATETLDKLSRSHRDSGGMSTSPSTRSSGLDTHQRGPGPSRSAERKKEAWNLGLLADHFAKSTQWGPARVSGGLWYKRRIRKTPRSNHCTSYFKFRK